MRSLTSLICLAAGLSAALLAPLHAAAAEHPGEVYTGTLGGQPIVMEIGGDDDKQGRYFYAKYCRDLPLRVTREDARHLELDEGRENDSDKPQFNLTEQSNGNWSGVWRAPKGKTLNVALRRASVPALAAGADHYLQVMRDKDLYEYLRLSSLTLRQGRREKFMGYTLQWWTEPDSKITLFEILDGYPDDARLRINQVLRDRLWSEVSSFHDCSLNASRYGAGSDFEQTVTPRLLSPAVVSVSIFTSYDCAGAHPDFGDNPLNLDARTARTFALEDILWIGQGSAFHYVDSSDNKVPSAFTDPAGSVSFDVFSSYRENALAPWLVKRFTALYRSQMKDGDCDYGDPGVWQFPSWYLTPKGIDFSPSFARAIRVCEANADGFVIPYADTKQHPGRLHLVLP